jgi:predicted transcriptional regulator
MSKRGFGELETAILRILKSGKRMSVKEVHALLGEPNKYNTIMTVMLRLAGKKILAREKIGIHYEYWLLSLQSNVPTFIEQLKKKIFGVSTKEMISYLIEAEDISKEDFEEMEKMIEKAKAKRAKL